jgi:glycine C-acetyltransferase
MLSETTELRDRLFDNTRLFRKGMEEAGFRIVPGIHPIVPVLFGHLPNDAKLSQDFANALLEEGIYVIGFYYPVVPKGKSRIRVQISAAHNHEQIEFAIEKFRKVGKSLGAI